jgi:hypothetical protein
VKRRDLLKAASTGIGAWTVGGLPARADAAGEAETLGQSVDVLVVGGGTAGTIAAIQAARAGAKTMLVEMGSQLGGTTTTGGVAFPGLFHAWGKQVIAGIGWELVTKAVGLDDGRLPDFSVIPPRHSQHQVRVNGPLYAALAEEACLAAKVEIHYYEFPRAARALPAGWQVEVVGKGIQRLVTCKQLIDCTGGADVVGMLGFARLRERTTQPGTLIFQLGGYDVERLDAKLVQERYEQAMRDGRLRPGDYAHAQGKFIGFLRSGGGNAQHVFGADSSTSATKTEANIAGRSSLLRLLRFVRALPGCEKARVLRMSAETGIRETYRIVGETRITQADYVAGRVFPDAVAHSFYPIDIHDEKGVVPQPLPKGVVPTVPLKALIPRASRNLLVAGRSVSSDRGANSALRVQASCMAMGQAAGAAASLAARRNLSPHEVPLDDLKTLLRQHGAIVP